MTIENAAPGTTGAPSTAAGPTTDTRASGVSRRRALALAGAGVGLAGAAAAGGALVHAAVAGRGAGGEAAGAIPFTGEHQAGIITPAQDRLHFVSFDVIT